MRQKPWGFDGWSHEQRQAWEKERREAADLADQVALKEQEIDDAQRRARQREREQYRVQEGMRSELAEANDLAASLEGEVAHYREFLRQRDLLGEFQTWLKHAAGE